MPRFTGEVQPTDKDGNPIDVTAAANANRTGSNQAYELVKPDYYYAVVTAIESGHYEGKSGNTTNPNRPSGKWNYETITPKYQLLNEAGTRIDKQTYTLGVYENGKFMRPDGQKISPIQLGTQFLLTALGVFSADPDDPTKFKFDVNFDLVKDRVVRVRTGLSGYIKTPRLNFEPSQLHELFTHLAGTDKYTYEQVPSLIDAFNSLDADGIAKALAKCSKLYNPPSPTDLVAARSGEGAEDAKLKVKNAVTNVFAISAADAAEHGWFYDEGTGSVFTLVEAWEQYVVLDDQDRNYTPPNM